MPDTDNNMALDCGARKALQLLEALKQSPSGAVVFQQIERLLRDLEDNHSKTVRGYAALVQTLLGAYRRQLRSDSLLQLELKLVQQRLEPPISLSELSALQVYAQNLAKLMGQLEPVETDILRTALQPLLGEPAAAPQQDAGQAPSAEHAQDPPASSPDAAPDSGLENRVASVYRQRLDKQRRDIQELQSNLSQKIREATRKHEEFGVLLEVVLGELKHASKTQDLNYLRQALVAEVEKLLSAHNELVRMLDETESFLHLIESNSRKLTDELNQVRVLSLTDELTALPNRRAFLRRLEDEIERAQRYRTPLVLGLLDLDHFKRVNDRFGHAVGDEILRLYANEVLSIFRRYDMVARYGGEEFAVLLPNTNREDARRAFEKVKQQASRVSYDNNGTAMRAPTFSAGLSLYRPGETVDSLIARADGVLYRAKQRGRDRVEIDEDYDSEGGRIVTNS